MTAFRYETHRHARDFPARFGLPTTAGLDIHSTRQQRRCGVTTPRRLTGGRDYVAALRSGKAVLFDATGREEFRPGGSPAPPPEPETRDA